MFILSIFSGVLFVLPVAVTLGVYIGFEHQKIFNGGNGTSGDSSSGNSSEPTYGTHTYCQKSYAVTPSPFRYVFNPNQWGDTDDQGDLCMNITTGVDDGYAADFAATWHYPIGPESQPVHAFPNANLNLTSVLPIKISNMSTLTLDVSWTYGLGNSIVDATNSTALTAAEVNANMCMDMFLDSDITHASSTVNSTYEVMVWLGRWGDATLPIGYAKGSQDNYTVNGTTFDLYHGENALGQRTFSWVAQANTTDFTGDVAPLVNRLSTKSGPEDDDYLGYVAFGSEALYSTDNVTFSVLKLDMNVAASQ